MKGAEWARNGVLVVGARGMLGCDLMSTLQRRRDGEQQEHITGWDIEDLDIRRGEQVLETLRRLRPSTVVNVAAYTDVDGCETNTDEAMAVNTEGPGNIARACAEINAVCVHLGTDFIFDGAAGRPYQVDDKANPLSVYGRSKWEGEQRVRASGCDHLVVRTSWLFGLHGRHFVEAILRQAKAGAPLSVVSDQVGCPTLASDLADALVRLLDVKARGTVHFANTGQCSWFEFAREILRQAGLDAEVKPICSRELGRAARRPTYSVLDSAKYTELTGHKPPTWQDALGRYFATCQGETCSHVERTCGSAIVDGPATRPGKYRDRDSE